jgi:anti-sigma factor RsiW
MLSCEVVSDLMVVYVSGEASPETQRLVEEHLSRCPTCRKALGDSRMVEQALAELDRGEEPANGREFLTRTRRLIYAIGVGGLFMLASVLAIFQWGMVDVMALNALASVPGHGLPWLAATAVVLALYVLLVRWRSQRESSTALGDLLLSLTISVPLLIAAVIAFELLATGAMLAASAAMLFLLAALGLTFALLPRLPYVTLAAVLVLLVVNGLLLGQTALGILILGDFSLESPIALGHPAEGVAVEDAVLIDMEPLSLEPVERMVVTAVGKVEIGPQSRAARASYKGDGRLVFVTVAESDSLQEVDGFFLSWKDTVCRIRISGVEINLPGLTDQGRIMRCYDPVTGTAYNAWRAGNWATIIEVPGAFSEASPLAREVKDLVTRSYLAGRQD